MYKRLLIVDSDIYYKDPLFFQRQCSVDIAVDDLSRMLSLPRSELGIVGITRFGI